MFSCVRKIKFKVHYWPVLTTLWLLLTYFSSYLISVLNGDVYPLFPYISDTGTLPVESCVFGQMLNIGALLMFICMFIRHHQVKLYAAEKYVARVKMENKWSFALGFLGCLGISIVANFQETNNLAMHMVGATMAFLIGSLYFIIQTLITFKMDVGKPIKIIRGIMAAISIPLFITTMVTATLASQSFKGDQSDQLHWDSDDEAYDLHLVSTITEWVMAINLNVFMMTFIGEFKQLKFDGVVFRM